MSKHAFKSRPQFMNLVGRMIVSGFENGFEPPFFDIESQQLKNAKRIKIVQTELDKDKPDMISKVFSKFPGLTQSPELKEQRCALKAMKKQLRFDGMVLKFKALIQEANTMEKCEELENHLKSDATTNQFLEFEPEAKELMGLFNNISNKKRQFDENSQTEVLHQVQQRRGEPPAMDPKTLWAKVLNECQGKSIEYIKEYMRYHHGGLGRAIFNERMDKSTFLTTIKMYVAEGQKPVEEHLFGFDIVRHEMSKGFKKQKSTKKKTERFMDVSKDSKTKQSK